MPDEPKTSDFRPASELDEPRHDYPALVIQVSQRTGFRPDELVYQKRWVKREERYVEVVYPTLGARLRRFHEDHPDDADLPEVYIRTKILDKTNLAQFAAVECEVKTKLGVFQDVGTASATRDNRMKATLLELAHSRSVSRALRLAGYGVEFDDSEGVLLNLDNEAQETTTAPAEVDEPEQRGPRIPKETCPECDSEAPKPVMDRAERDVGKRVCRKCAMKAMKEAAPAEDVHDGDPEPAPQAPPEGDEKQTPNAKAPSKKDTEKVADSCAECGRKVGTATATVSKKKYDRVLCAPHQKEATQ